MNWEWAFNTEAWEWASYVVTVFALPFGIAVFVHEQRRERQNEDEELYQRLSDEYAEFSKLLLSNTDLGLMTHPTQYRTLGEEQTERRNILFDILISSFRARLHLGLRRKNERAGRASLGLMGRLHPLLVPSR